MADVKAFSTANLNLYYGNYTSGSDKEITAGFNVFNGRGSFAIRRKGQTGRPLASVSLRPEQLWSFVYAADKLAAKGPETKIKMTVSQWDNEARKFKDTGVVVLGIDKNFVPYLGVSTPEMGSHGFPIRLSRPSIANDELFTKEEMAAITIKTVFRDAAEHLTYMEVLSNEKRSFNQNRSGGNSGYNNSSNNNSSNKSSGKDPMDLDDDMPF